MPGRGVRQPEDGRDGQQRHLQFAPLLRLPAPGAEAAAGGRVGGRRDVAVQDDPLPVLPGRRVRHRDRGQQRLGVGVRGVVVDLLVRADLDDPAQVHHPDPVGDVPDDRQVVRDEHVAQPELSLEPVQQVDDLRLYGDVEGGDGLVGDDDLGVQGQTAGDADALALTAGELVRIAVDVLRVEPDDVQQLLDPAAPVALRGDLGVDLVRLPDDVADRHARVQRGVGVLEHHLDVAAHRLQGAPGQLGDVLALVPDRAGRRLFQVHQHLGHGRLPAAGLPHDAERLARREVEGDPVDRLDGTDLLLDQDSLGQRVVLDQIADLQDRFAARRGGGGP
ncbi:hypothetical protein EES42_03360 [Streptomyces sp. ADI95-17]|nr:hypothetical protein EES42_03360 [Streptomyces sp. ADI95-17]